MAIYDLLSYTHASNVRGEMPVAKTVYLGLGSNIGDRKAIIQQAIGLIAAMPETKDFKVSSFYDTSPVSDIPQPDYLNAVCCFKTELNPLSLFKYLKAIETSLGKEIKPKNAPRMIDIDLLFFGSESFREEELEIPHPRWRERLFVIVPLLDLTTVIAVPRGEQGEEMIDLIKLRDSVAQNGSQSIKKYEG